MQQIPNIVKIEDNDCNSLTVEVGSDSSHENIKTTKMRKLQNVKKRKKTRK